MSVKKICAWVVLILTVSLLVFVFGMVIATRPAKAHDNGQYSSVDAKIKTCVQSLKSDASPEGCCSSADGFPVEADDWGRQPDGHYKVKITFNGKSGWYEVPSNAMLEPSVCGLKYAIVWWYHSQDEKTKKDKPVIRCFKTGIEF